MPYPDGSNERAAQAAYETVARHVLAAPGWRELPASEHNMWRDAAFAARAAAGDVPDHRGVGRTGADEWLAAAS
jgi:hypothetical protein